MEKLDVESEDARQLRIRSALERLNDTSKPSSTTPPSFSLEKIGQTSGPHAIEPLSELLARVQAFLPQLEAANVALESKVTHDPSSVDIEHLEPDAERYIEMNLGLGVYEQRRAGSQSGDENTSDTSDSSSDGGDREDNDLDSDGDDSDFDSSSSDAESSDDTSSDSIISRSSASHSDSSPSPSSSPVLSRVIKPLPKRRRRSAPATVDISDGTAPAPQGRRPEIVVLASSTTFAVPETADDMQADDS